MTLICPNGCFSGDKTLDVLDDLLSLNPIQSLEFSSVGKSTTHLPGPSDRLSAAMQRLRHGIKHMDIYEAK